MIPDLDAILRTTKKTELKSSGERRIAEFLDQCGIRYMYESPVAVKHRGHVRLWYPDFFLSDLGVYVEYYGVQGNADYDQGILEKQAAYKESGLAVIPVYPSHLRDKWPHYLVREIQEVANYRQRLSGVMFSRKQHDHALDRYCL
jgi:hypothetical protein